MNVFLLSALYLIHVTHQYAGILFLIYIVSVTMGNSYSLPEASVEEANIDDSIYEVSDMKGNSSSFPETHVEEAKMDKGWNERNIRKISEDDLEKTFSLLKKRCPKTWKTKYEVRARALHKNIMILRNAKTVNFIDPAQIYSKAGHKSNETVNNAENTARRLMTEASQWKMENKENAKEFFEILRHFTKYTPFEGRPFVSAWLEALLPCLCRWVLSSIKTDIAKDKAMSVKKRANNLVVPTLKHFMGAFGQPGIVCCLADRGAKILKTLQYAARAVEATGRGDAELYYWKRIVESSCGGTKNWGQLAELEDDSVKLSQLDNLPLG
jgi:hypothetical protein